MFTKRLIVCGGVYLDSCLREDWMASPCAEELRLLRLFYQSSKGLNLHVLMLPL